MGKTSNQQMMANLIRFLLVPLLMIPGWVNAKSTNPVKAELPDFSILVDVAVIAGCFSLAVAGVWATGLILSARIRMKGGTKCG
jgi:hypothetical protein